MKPNLNKETNMLAQQPSIDNGCSTSLIKIKEYPNQIPIESKISLKMKDKESRLVAKSCTKFLHKEEEIIEHNYMETKKLEDGNEQVQDEMMISDEETD